MASEEKLDETRIAASEILALPPADVENVFHAQMKGRKLGRLVRLLDRLATQEGDDRRLAATALERLGFPVVRTER